MEFASAVRHERNSATAGLNAKGQVAAVIARRLVLARIAKVQRWSACRLRSPPQCLLNRCR